MGLFEERFDELVKTKNLALRAFCQEIFEQGARAAIDNMLGSTNLVFNDLDKIIEELETELEKFSEFK